MTGDVSQTKGMLFFVPHTHWEGAVFKTREDYLDMGLPHILWALKLLKRYPNYRFVLDQAAYVKPFLERYPQEVDTFQRFVDEGRLGIVGGMDVMPDNNMPGGESFVRQILYGKGYFRKTLGVDVTVAWQLDTFGHNAQTPQLLKLAGYKTFYFSRGVHSPTNPHEFIWQGIDGSQIIAFWLYGYGALYNTPRTLPEFTSFLRRAWDDMSPTASGPVRLGLSGADVTPPEDHVPVLEQHFNQQPGMSFTMRLSTPAEYESALLPHAEWPVVSGELNPIFQGTYSSRIELKQHTREIERLLTTAEKLGVLLRWLGEPVDDEVVWRAWEPALFNQTHDLMSGVMTDYVYEDVVHSYEFSRRLGQALVDERLRQIAPHIDTRGEGTPLVVYNTLGWPRTDIAFAKVGFSDESVMNLRLVDADGQNVPVQIMSARRHENGALLEAEIAFLARDVPALGHAVYHVSPLAEVGTTAETLTVLTNTLENDSIRVTFDPSTGALTSLVYKPTGWEVLSAPANVVAQQQDHGDLWEPYHPLNGAQAIAMDTPHPPPQPRQATFSTQQQGVPAKVICGPVVSEFKVEHSFGERSHFATTVRIYAGLPRVDIRTRILNNDEFVRYRALFPTSIRSGKRTDEIPFGAIERPEEIEFPAQNWIDYSEGVGDGVKGVTLFNRGLPGNNVSGGTLMLSLLRSTRIVSYGYGGGYEPGMGSDSGLELGKQLVFDYALLPHAGDWRQAAVYRTGWEFNHPLIVRTASPHAGGGLQRWGLLEISHPNVIVSAMKPGSDGSAVLRLYEAAGQQTEGVRIRLDARVVSAEEVNLMEDPGTPLLVRDNGVELSLHPYEIQTIKFRLAPA